MGDIDDDDDYDYDDEGMLFFGESFVVVLRLFFRSQGSGARDD